MYNVSKQNQKAPLFKTKKSQQMNKS